MNGYQEENNEKKSWLEKNKTIISLVGIFFVLALLIVIVFLAIGMVEKAKKGNGVRPDKEIETAPVFEDKETGLPIVAEKDAGLDGENGPTEEAGAEAVGFGDFYKAPAMDFVVSASEYSLPLNIKVDVANYHDFSRKINLAEAIDSLNDNGFAQIANPFSAEADDFYALYGLLNKKEVPALITSDFLVYYYQNILKLVFKDIEATVFYENLWETNKRLYEIAKERYERKLEEEGLINDVFLEGARKELAFFAVTLTLLAPAPNQIEKETSLVKKGDFSQAEANKFSLTLPAYLKNDVLAEVELIRAGKAEAKSPVLLFSKNYKDFLPPVEYKANSRLNNFYLASLWLNSVFPLYYRNDDCQNCLLDKEDWRVSTIAALLLAKDLSASQKLKNNWAKIYKIKSFFQGLRGDLNYLHYLSSFEEMFGKEKSVEEIFSKDMGEIDSRLSAFQEKIASFDFPEIEGGLNRESEELKPMLGLKMLTGSYWPNDYIFGQLTRPFTGSFLGSENEAKSVANSTGCIEDKKAYRCFGFGLDIVGLTYEGEKHKSEYFIGNTRYENYEIQASKLKNQLNNFTVNSWHSNNYWTTLDIAGKILATPDNLKYVFFRNELFGKKEIETVLSAWVNLQLPPDVFAVPKEDSVIRLDQTGADNQFANLAYIEPNLALVRELVAKTEMILKMLSFLKVNEHENTVLIDLANLKSSLDVVEAIVKKELSGEELTEDDYKFINSFIKKFEVKEKGNKNLVFTSPYQRGNLTESLAGQKLLLVVYKKGEKNFLAVGPSFNYWENRK